MQVHHRKNRVPIRVSGTDAAKLLNDVLTGSFASSQKNANWWALLSPQGKVQAEGLAGWAEAAFWLDVDVSVAEAFLKRMSLYKLRADVTFENLAETHAVGWSDSIPDSGIVHGDSRAGGFGARVIAPLNEIADWANDDGFLERRISLAIPELGMDFDADTVFPHDIAMDFLGGIDFEKGCYVGQEVVSRMKHRGTARRRPVIVSGDHLETGAPVMASDREAGQLGKVHNGRAIAIIRLDRVEDLGAVRVSDAPVALALPAWASYRFGESSAD